MASSVFFKFKSQKEPTRVEFDGTGISVFELKREIITKSGLGDGTDFDLSIYTDDNSEGWFAIHDTMRRSRVADHNLEYDDDTTIIPRSTTVIARRQPALKPGAGRAARYVSGKAPVNAKNAGRREQASKASASKTSSNAMNQMNAAMTEEEKMAAMFAAQSEQWNAQQEEMSQYVHATAYHTTFANKNSQTPVFKPGTKRPPTNVPDRDPPNGYICYRCGQKGHWIQLCPTNDDPEFDNRPRVKRTTGIPRSFLQKVDKSVILAQTDGDETKRPSGVMVNADGDYVIAEPDKASWEQFQAKTKTSTAAKEEAANDEKEAQEKGLACPIDKKLLIEPMKTPCCKKSFCNDCITNALIESDFVCPSCQTESVLIDDLVPDEDVGKKIQEYIKEKEAAKATPPASPKAEKPEEVVQDQPANTQDGKADLKDTAQPTTTKENAAEGSTALEATASPKKEGSVKSPSTTPAQDKEGSPSTDTVEEIKSDEIKSDDSKSKKRPADEFLENPKIPKGPRAMQQQQQAQQQQFNQMPNMMNGMPDMGMMFNGMPMMPNMMGMPGMGMGMGMPNMMNMPMMGMPNMNMGGFNGMNGMNGMSNGAWDMNGMNHNMAMNGGPGMMNNNGGGNFPVRHNFTQPQQDDDAYFRKPVNPHRHQNKGRKSRPSDYREL